MNQYAAWTAALALTLLSVLTGCGGSDAPQVAVPVTELRQEQLKAITSAGWDQKTYVVRSQEEWSKAWATRNADIEFMCKEYRICPSEKETQIPVDIDFTKYTLVGVYGPLEFNRALNLESVVQEGGVIKVQTRFVAGFSNQPYYWLQKSFWSFFLIPATTLPVEFKQTSEAFLAYEILNTGWTFVDIGEAKSVTFAFHNEADWLAAWKVQEASYYYYPVEIPKVNFDTDMVIGLSYGLGPSLCYSMNILNVVEEENAIRVLYTNSVPPPEAICPASIADLSRFFTLKKSDKPIKFVQYIWK
jgi:hypothetical protein